MTKSKIISSVSIYQSKWLELIKDEIVKPDGTKAIHEVIKRNNGVLIVGVHEGKIFLVKQYRYPVDEFTLELPGGFIEPGESAEDTVRRELAEEVGFEPQKLRHLSTLYTSPGLLTQTMAIYLAEDCKKVKSEKDSSEQDLRHFHYSIEEIKELISKGEIKHSLTLAAFFLYMNLSL
jgi:ADP-ribose pyrophosphatase